MVIYLLCRQATNTKLVVLVSAVRNVVQVQSIDRVIFEVFGIEDLAGLGMEFIS